MAGVFVRHHVTAAEHCGLMIMNDAGWLVEYDDCCRNNLWQAAMEKDPYHHVEAATLRELYDYWRSYTRAMARPESPKKVRD